MAIRIVIADDHPIVLRGVQSTLSFDHDLEVVACCERGDAVLATVQEHRPDILILDLRLPGCDGLMVAEQLAQANLPTRVVVLTAAITPDELLGLIRSGVAGVVLKDTAADLLIRAIRKVHAGGHWLETSSAMSALQRAASGVAAKGKLSERLSEREIEIVSAVCEGLRNKEIADRLHISEGTVKMHLHNVYEKLGVRSRTELSAYANQTGGFRRPSG